MNAYKYAMNKVFHLFRQHIEGKYDYQALYTYAGIVGMLDFLDLLEALFDAGVIKYQDGDWKF